MSAPDRLKAAEDRLNQAIDRLDAVVAAHPKAGGPAALQAELKALKDENQDLRTVLGGTAKRLDGTIAKFKAKLEAE